MGGESSRDKAKSSGSHLGSEANAQLSRAEPQANPFVAFNVGVSKEDRKAVRVQAAKASAAARKATIARKLAEQAGQKKAPAESSSAPITVPPSPRSPPSRRAPTASGKGKRKRTSPQPGDWRLQTGRFRGSGHACVGARKHRASPEVDEEVARGPDEQQPSYFGLLTPGEPLSQDSTAPHQHWQQFLQLQADGGSVPEANVNLPWFAPDHHAHGKGTFNNPNAELPLTPASMVSVPSPTKVGLDRIDPFNCYPVPYRPVYDGLLHHMMTVFAPRGWPALKITTQEGLNWEHFMTQHALAEPALFFVRLLFASGDMIRLGVLKTDVSWWLQAEAIMAINEALAQPDRAISDGLILAVGRIALHESMYGDRNAANIMHRPAQRRMIDMRGGMNALDFPLLVKRLMRWADRVMSVQGGTERFLPDNEDQGNETFTTAQSVNVLEQWVPQEGRALRKKIAISDLLSD